MTAQHRHRGPLLPRWATISGGATYPFVGRLRGRFGVGRGLWVLPEGGSFYGYGTSSTFIHTPAARIYVSASYAMTTT